MEGKGVVKLTKRHRRVEQILRWLDAVEATPFPVSLRWAHLGDDAAETERVRHRIWITIDPRIREGWVLNSTLLHEYAHALIWKTSRAEARKHRNRDHDAEWGVTYARLYSRFIDRGGWKESKKY